MMQYESVQISGLAHIDAPLALSSEEIEERLAPTMRRLGLPRGLLRKLSGIESRRLFAEDTPPSEAATRAAEKAIRAAGVAREDIGVIVNTSVSRDFIEPSTACIVHHNLGLGPDCLNFDIGNACLGFINGMEMVATMIERGQIETGLVVNGENSHSATNRTIERLLDPAVDFSTFRNNFATLTLGSGAVAMVLGRSRQEAGEHRFLGGVTMAATEHCRLCTAQVDSMITNTKKLLNQGVELAIRTWGWAADALGWSADALDHVIIHQVGQSHTDRLMRRLGIDLAKVFRLYPLHGNVGPAGVPIVLSKLLEQDRLLPGHRVALMGIGSGLNCTMAEVVW
jgi:3-oxoacyl-[acyl-carrier-protein] synthase III